MNHEPQIYRPDSFWESPYAYDGPRLRKDEARALGYMIKNWRMGRDPAVDGDRLTERQKRALNGLLRRGLVSRVVHDVYPVDTLRARIGESVFPCSLVDQ